MTRFDILSPRPRKDGKTYWLKVGAAFEAKNGGYNIVLDALPIPDHEGRVSLLMKEPTPREDRQQYDQSPQGNRRGGIDEDSTPF